MKERQALIDKMILKDIVIEGIMNVDELIYRGILKQDHSSNSISYITDTGQSFTSLLIKNDGFINKFTAGVFSGVRYCNLSLVIPRNNLECFTVEEYNTKLLEIQQHLMNEYGIAIDYSQAKIKQIEINRTFQLDCDFNEYDRVFCSLGG